MVDEPFKALQGTYSQRQQSVLDSQCPRSPMRQFGFIVVAVFNSNRERLERIRPPQQNLWVDGYDREVRLGIL